MARAGDASRKPWMTWKDALDAVVKLIVAGVGIFVVVIANDFQSSLTTSNVLNQREQAESQLRAQMFGDLIRPLTTTSAAQSLTADQELLLAELLALNFHENFEFKPLLVHIDERLKAEKKGSVADRAAKRDELRSVANRVMQRQVAMLTRLPKSVNADRKDAAPAPPTQGCMTRIAVLLVEAPEALPPGGETSSAVDSCARLVVTRPLEQITLKSPSGRYELLIEIAKDINVIDETIDVHFRIADKGDVKAGPAATDVMAKCLTDDPTPPWKQCVYTEVYRERAREPATRAVTRAVEPNLVAGDFTLTRFDLPLTDYTLLHDGTRFAMFIDGFDREAKLAMLTLLWFPADYVSPRERPWSYRQLFERMELSGQDRERPWGIRRLLERIKLR